MTKSTIYLVIALVTAAVVMTDFFGWNDVASRPPRPAGKPTQAAIYAPGIVEGTTSEIQLRMEASGRIAGVYVQEGQWVRQGDLLVEIANDEHRHKVALATANLQRSQAELQKLLNGAREMERNEQVNLYEATLAEYQRAEKTWNAVQRLRESNAATVEESDHHFFRLNKLRSEVAAAKARVELINAEPRLEDVQIAQARVANATAELNAAQTQFEKTRLLAPRDGQILDVNALEGETAGPDSRQPAVIMVDSSQLFVVAYLEEYDAMRVDHTCAIRITADGLDQDVSGEIASLSPLMERKEIASLQPNELHDVRTRKARIRIIEDAKLIIGLPVDVYFEPQVR